MEMLLVSEFDMFAVGVSCKSLMVVRAQFMGSATRKGARKWLGGQAVAMKVVKFGVECSIPG